MKKFNKIELSPQLPQIFPIKFKFNDEDCIYDFSKEFDDELSRLIAKVFYDKYITLTSHSRGRSYYGIGKFLTYLKENNVFKCADLHIQHLTGFALWLDSQNLSLNTKYGHYNNIEVLIQDSKKLPNSPLINFNIPTNPFRNSNSERPIPKKLTEEQLKVVLSICYKKIDYYINEFRTAQTNIEILEKEFMKGASFNRHDKYHVIHYFYKKFGYAPFIKNISNTEAAYIKDTGGVNTILNAITPDAHILLPFYLVLMFELAANSDALRLIKADCIKEDPLFEDRSYIIWNKGRASSPQKRNVFKKKKYGAYQLIEMIKEITQHTRKQIKEEDRISLFVIRGESAKKTFLVPHEESFRLAIESLCKLNNLDFHFNPSDIRPSVLTEMYKARKDIIGISKIANHKSINTTLLYVVDEETKKENRKYLSEKQSLMFDRFSQNNENLNNQQKDEIIEAENIGFICKNPIIEKKVCVNWMAELTNPDLIIPASAEYLSKIIALKNSIINAKNYMNQDRFLLLYRPIIQVIDDQILTQFSNKLIKESTILAKTIKLPLLEEY